MLRPALAAAVLAALTAPAAAQSWTFQGPVGIANGQVSPSGVVSGSIREVLVDPTANNTIYVGAVNGGVWKSTTGGTSWTPLTDTIGSTAVGGLAFDPTAGGNTLVTGFGRGPSSFYGDGGRQGGVAFSLDAGATWTTRFTLPSETAVSGVAARSLGVGTGTIVVSANNGSTSYGNQGVFRSTNGGTTFTQISGGSGTGLPTMSAYEITENATNANQLFTVPYLTLSGTSASYSVYRSNDAGGTWAALGNATMQTQIAAASNVKVSAHGNVVVVGIISGATPTIWRSTDGGTVWTAATNVPLSNPGNQGYIHFDVLLDPTDPTGNRVYLTGDATQSSPFNGRVYRGDLSTNAWTTLFSNGSNAPHADGRALVIRPDTGALLHGSDGGLATLSNPSGSFGTWGQLNAGLGITEIHSLGFDPVSRTLFGGTQDNGTVRQTATGSTNWTSVLGGDGSKVAVVRDPNNPNQSIRYSSYQYFGNTAGNFFRLTFNNTGGMVGGYTTAALTVTAASQNLFAYEAANGSGIQFYGPVATNRADGNRLYLGTRRVYESLNQGDNLTVLKDFGTGFTVNVMKADGFSGTTPRPEVLYVGANNQLWVRPDTGGALVQRTAYTGGSIADLALQPSNWQHITVTDSSSVFRSDDAGVTISGITGDLLTGHPGAGRIYSVEAMRFGSTDVYLAGTRTGVFVTTSDDLGTWNLLGTDLPNGIAIDLVYDVESDTLAVSSLGRGAWTINGFSGHFTPVPEPASVLAVAALALGAAGARRRRPRPG